MKNAIFAALGLGLIVGGCSKEPADALPMPVIPQTSALHATEAVLTALKEGNPAGFWAAMPEKWQGDVNFLVREFGYKVDPGLYDETCDLVGRLVTVLRQKEHYFFNSPMLRQQPQMQATALRQNWGSVMDFMDVLLESQLGDSKGIRSFDGGLFLRVAGGRFFDAMRPIADAQGFDLMARLSEIKVEAVKQDGAAQVLRFTSPDEEPEEMRFIMVGGRWVPEPLALDWDEEMERAKRDVEKVPDMTDAQTQMQFKMFLGMFSGIVDRLEQVDSQEEFDQVFKGMGGMMSRPPR